MPTVSPRVAALLASLTTSEKIAQLVGLWSGANQGGVVAPEMETTRGGPVPQFADFAQHGLGQLTRVFGTKPVTPAQGLATLLDCQRWIRDHTRVPIGLLAHEECLTGLAAWTATTFPTPLAWAASFAPDLTFAIGQAIGQTMAGLGVHQGLAPVLDVVRDARWGRVEETMGEDPYVIASLGKGYITGLQSAGIVATAKHFVGYSNSWGGRNLAPAHAGPREIEETFLPPFEVAVRDAGLGSVMPAYVEIDGVPVHDDHHLLTEILRQRWGFEGTVVADYFGVAFLSSQHAVAADLADAAAQGLLAGVDVELPTGDAFLTAGFLQRCQTDPALAAALDTAVTRVLVQKERLGLLDIDAEIARLEALLAEAPTSLDPPAHRGVAAAMAEASVILLANDGRLPLPAKPGLRLGLIGPNADRAAALFGCYSFVNHVLTHHRDVAAGIEAPTVLDALQAEYPEARIEVATGCGVTDPDRSGFTRAVELANHCDVAIVVVGDQAGLFGNGTSGEGCDADSLDLPGVQTELVEAVLDSGTPVVLVALTGRPYALGRLAERAAATIQAFFPGEAGAQAIAGVISGRINPSGHLPVSLPRGLGALPYSYLHPKLGEANSVSSIDPTPQFRFGHGLSYSQFDYSGFEVSSEAATDGWIEAGVWLRNSGDRAGTALVQVYGHDVVASVTRPLRQLLAFGRVALAPGQSARVTCRIPTTRFALIDRQMNRVVEPGEVQLWFGLDCDQPATALATVRLTGPVAPVTGDSPRLAQVSIAR